MPILQVQVDDDMARAIKTLAESRGMRKPSGDANVSEALRLLIQFGLPVLTIKPDASGIRAQVQDTGRGYGVGQIRTGERNE